MTDAAGNRLKSLKNETLEMVSRMPVFSRAPRKRQVAVANYFFKKILLANPERPLGAAEALKDIRKFSSKEISALKHPMGTSPEGHGSGIGKSPRMRALGLTGKVTRAGKSSVARSKDRGVDQFERNTLRRGRIKARYFTNRSKVAYQVISVEKLAQLYPRGGAVTVSDLISKGVLKPSEQVRIGGNGIIAVKIKISSDIVTGEAERKILKAGGTIVE